MAIIGKLTYFWTDFRGWIIGYAVSVILLSFVGRWIIIQIRNRRQGIAINIGLSSWILIFLLIHLALAAELYFRYQFDQTDNVFQIQTTKRWADRHVILNGFGYRDEQFSQEKDPKETRIAVLGDSFTWGYGINNQADRYSDILQEKLSARCGEPNRIKAYTMALPGRNTRDHLEALRNMSHFNFDSVILGYYMDDTSSAQSVRHFQHCYHKVFDYRRNPILKPVLDNSFFLQYLWVRLYNRFLNPEYAKTCWDTNYASLYQDPEVWSRHLLELQQLINYTKDKRLDLAVVIFPFMNLIGPDYPAAKPAERLTSFFEQQNIPVVNLAPLLSNYTPRQVMVSPRDFHANEFVHGLATEKLMEKIQGLDGFACRV